MLDVDTREDFLNLIDFILSWILKMISALVLAAGLSRRMGTSKMTLPWGNSTVINQVISVLTAAKIGEILVVTGGGQKDVERVLTNAPVKFVLNTHYDQSEMIDSLQLGLCECSPESEAALIALGDQPQIQLEIVQKIVKAYEGNKSPIVIPSYQMRRGHPWLVNRIFWQQIADIRAPDTLRNFLEVNKDRIEYVCVDNDLILRDLDTPDDYAREKPSV